MLAQVHALALTGLIACPVMVEVDLAGGLPLFEVVGLPDASVRESRDRVRAGLRNSGFDFPVRRITVNLAPAHMRKVGASFDLPIALGVLAAAGHIPQESLATACFAGELALDGTLRGVQGALCLASTPSANTPSLLILPAANVSELTLGPPARPVLLAQHLSEVVAYLLHGEPLAAVPEPVMAFSPNAAPDLRTVQGQSGARRALEIAAAGRHNLLLFGPPGEGKTLLATCLSGILPPLTTQEQLDVARVYSAAGLLSQLPSTGRPVRVPHHTISASAMVGGSSTYPGEITLAHQGVLLLDELPEFHNDVLTALRQPMEAGYVWVGRGSKRTRYPADCQVVATANPCPCGWLGDARRKCACTDGALDRYRRKFSGPLLDRFDLFVNVAPAHAGVTGAEGESSQQVRERVLAAWERQLQRTQPHAVLTVGGGSGTMDDVATSSAGWANSHLLAGQLVDACRLSAESTAFLQAAAARLALSTRAVTRVMRVARTIADLAARDQVATADLAEAISYRHL